MIAKWMAVLMSGLLVAGLAGCGGKEDSDKSSGKGDRYDAPDVIDMSGIPTVQRQAIIAGWKNALREYSKGIDEFSAKVAEEAESDPEMQKIKEDLAAKLKAAKTKLDAAEKASDTSWQQAHSEAVAAMTEINTVLAEATRKMLARQMEKMPSPPAPEK